jgi:hypothetical protein
MEFKNLKISYGGERYSKEYKDFFQKKVSEYQACFIVKKLEKHFKLGGIWVRFYSNDWDSGRASRCRYSIRLCRNPSLGVICHEVNHFLCWKIERTKQCEDIRHGTKKWNRNLQKIFKYCAKKNFWQEEMDRKTAPKPAKPEPTDNELRMQKIQKLEDRKASYERRIKLSENRIKKLNRQIAGLTRFTI